MHAEAQIQEDFVIQRCGNSFKLIGWVDMGEESFLIHVMRTGGVERFPVAH